MAGTGGELALEIPFACTIPFVLVYDAIRSFYIYIFLFAKESFVPTNGDARIHNVDVLWFIRTCISVQMHGRVDGGSLVSLI